MRPDKAAVSTLGGSRSGRDAARAGIVPIGLRLGVTAVLWRSWSRQKMLREATLGLGVHELLGPFQRCWRQVAASHTSKNDWHQGRWDAALQRRSQNVVLGSSLFKAKPFLTGPLLFLLPLVLFRFREQPRSHGVFRALPAWGRRGQLTQMLALLLSLGWRGRRRRWTLPE